MKTESKPTSSARHEKPSNLPGANCSADALYPSFAMARQLLDIDTFITLRKRAAENENGATGTSF
jgi:hypothetical protein